MLGWLIPLLIVTGSVLLLSTLGLVVGRLRWGNSAEVMGFALFVTLIPLIGFSIAVPVWGAIICPLLMDYAMFSAAGMGMFFVLLVGMLLMMQVLTPVAMDKMGPGGMIYMAPMLLGLASLGLCWAVRVVMALIELLTRPS